MQNLSALLLKECTQYVCMLCSIFCDPNYKKLQVTEDERIDGLTDKFGHVFLGILSVGDFLP